jgi:hypothetical protein
LSLQQVRDKISQRIIIKLAKEMMADSKDEFKQFLDEVANTMQERGLTDEILNNILKEDE